jgi:hypothetical protein
VDVGVVDGVDLGGDDADEGVYEAGGDGLDALLKVVDELESKQNRGRRKGEEGELRREGLQLGSDRREGSMRRGGESVPGRERGSRDERS